MESVYIDIHIHTSENPDSLNLSYDIDTLFKNIRQSSQGQKALISFTDHNTINKRVYLDALSKCENDIHLLLGVELHVHYVSSTEAYHCHMLFKNDITDNEIDDINAILDKLYPHKVVEKKDESIPTLDVLINEFDSYDFVLLPHGGQTHATFDKSIPTGRRFDTMMERSVYYNQFDGFTARSESGREETDQYFKRLGISGFVNLITCSDNYNPSRYPEAKDSKAEALIPTWMFANPTFEGLRLSLSEKSRLVYQQQKPSSWSEYIEQVKYSNGKIDIDVNFSSGLNVVIGGSSSGKTLLVDSIWRKLSNDSFETSHYNEFEVNKINIINSSGIQPHYLSQNYIMQVVGDDSDHRIESIDIIRSIFPDNTEVTNQVNASLATLKEDVSQLIQTVKKIESIEDRLRKTSQIGHLLVMSNVKKNIFNAIVPKEDVRSTIQYDKSKKDRHIETLKDIKSFINPLAELNQCIFNSANRLIV